MVQNVDLRPTFAAMAQTKAPDYVDGVSFLDVAQGTGKFPRQYAYSERLGSEGGSTIEGDADWKAVYTPDTAYHYWFPTGEVELYDLDADPYELENRLAGNDSEAEVAPLPGGLAADAGLPRRGVQQVGKRAGSRSGSPRWSSARAPKAANGAWVAPAGADP